MEMIKNAAPKIKSNWVTFAKGIHLLTFTNTTYKPTMGDNTELTEMSSVITSTESIIPGTNICCGDSEVATTCYDDSGFGKANDRYVAGQFMAGDYYQVMVRTFPTYNTKELEEINVPLELFNLAGSVYTVIFSACLAIVTVTRWISPSKANHHENTKSAL